MSNTRDFSALKSEEGWSTVRRDNRRPENRRPQIRITSPQQAIREEREARARAIREAEERRVAQAELNEVNFPSLASSFAAPKPSVWAKSGTELAQAWKSADEERAARLHAEEALRRQEAERERRETSWYLSRCMMSRTARRYEQDTYYEDDEEDELPPANGGAGYAPPPQDDWERVQKKTRVRRERDPLAEKEEPSSVWEEDQDDGPADGYDWTARPGRRNNDSLY
jgi:hypothetical protein